MNLTNLKKWITALRSGEYQQGRNCLRNTNNEFCCLGVATDIALKEVGGKWEKRDRDGSGSYDATIGDAIVGWAYLPTFVQEWLSSATSDVRISNRNLLKQIKDYNPSPYWTGEPLSNLNDNVKLTFHQIADLLEAEYLNDPVSEPSTVG